jgi:uncharacterized protein YutE (UPF0331/DUF86 family)
MSEDTVAQKITSLQRCVSQARVALSTAGSDFKTNHLLQDAAVLNIIRACETALDLANMLIRKRRLGIPSESRESFGILMREQILEQGLGDKLQKMVGSRNLALHRYRDLDMDIVQSVIQKNLDDLLAFAKIVQPHLS